MRALAVGDLKAARRLLQDYKDKDLDFGLDTQAMGELIQGDTEWAETIISAFGSTNGMYVCASIAVVHLAQTWSWFQSQCAGLHLRRVPRVLRPSAREGRK